MRGKSTSTRVWVDLRCICRTKYGRGSVLSLTTLNFGRFYVKDDSHVFLE